MQRLDQDLKTTKEAARILGLSHQTLEKWRVRRKGPKFLKLGNKAVRYRPLDIEAFIDGGADV